MNVRFSPIRFGNTPNQLAARKTMGDEAAAARELQAQLVNSTLAAFLKRPILPAIKDIPALIGRDLLGVVVDLSVRNTQPDAWERPGVYQYDFEALLKGAFSNEDRSKIQTALAEAVKLKLLTETKGSIPSYPEDEYKNTFTVGYALTPLGQLARECA